MTEEEFWATMAPVADPVYMYRLYHDDNGVPLFYSMEDLPGKYVELDQATFANMPSNVRVINGKLTYLKSPVALKLQPSDTGTPCHTQNVSVVVSETQAHTKWILK